jgi:hypothetical protein
MVLKGQNEQAIPMLDTKLNHFSPLKEMYEYLKQSEKDCKNQ